MRQSRRCAWHQPRSSAVILGVAITSLALLVPATVGTADVAAAAPAAAYTATLIPNAAEAYSVAVDATTDTAYFSDIVGDEITVVDGATNTVGTPIPLTGSPRGIAVDAETDTIYVALPFSTATDTPALAVIDGSTGAVTDTIPLAAANSGWGGVAVDSTTDTVYVAEYTAGAVAVINGSTNSVTTVSTGTASEPEDLAVDETSDSVWVGSLRGDVFDISGATNTVTQTISLGGAAVDNVAANPASGTVYATVPSDSGIAVIDEATGTVTGYISPPFPIAGLAVDSGSGTVFATTPDSSISGGSGTTWVIDDTTNAITDTIQRGGYQIAEDTATGTAYVAPYAEQTNAVWVLAPSATDAMSPVIKSTSATFSAGSYGSFTLVGSALPAATYTETGALPSGVTLSSAGTLSGTPATGSGGAYSVTITASNGVAPDYSQIFTLDVDEAPTLSAPSAETFQVGTPVSVPISVTGYPPPDVTATNLPAGVTLTESSTGSWQLSGTPDAETGGTYTSELTAENEFGTTPSVPMAITVLQAPAFTSAAQTTFVANTSSSFTVTATGFPAPSFSESGPLPSGVTFTSGGVLSGTPATGTVGSYPMTITATSSAGTATQSFSLTVTASPAAAAIGVQGTNGALYVQAPQLTAGWQSLGGQITGPPAVVAAPNPDGASPESPLFVATGTNGYLYVRSLTLGWQRVGPETASCLGSPAAVITGSTLTVACEGANRALFYNTAPLPSSGLPAFTTGWTNLGGTLAAGPAIAPVGGTLTFFALGTNGHIYLRTLTTGFAEQPWTCTGSPAAALQAASGVTVFGCHGGGNALWEATSSGSGWSSPVSLGGTLIGGPAIAATSQQIEFFAEGTSAAVYERTLATGWASLGGSVIGGVGAAGLN
jgi:large repetitive protein